MQFSNENTPEQGAITRKIQWISLVQAEDKFTEAVFASETSAFNPWYYFILLI